MHAEQTKSGAHYKLSRALKKTLLSWSCLSGPILILPCGYKDSLHFLALVLRYFQFAHQCGYSFSCKYFFSFILGLNFYGQTNLCGRIFSYPVPLID